MTKEEYEDFALRYKGCGACFPMYHKLSRFEKMWFSAIQKDVAKLEKENLYYKDVIETNSAEWEEQGQRVVEFEKELQTVKQNKHTVAHLGECTEKIQDKKIAELEAQIEKMKCCSNCVYLAGCDLSGYEECKNFDKWELREIKEND